MRLNYLIFLQWAAGVLMTNTMLTAATADTTYPCSASYYVSFKIDSTITVNDGFTYSTDSLVVVNILASAGYTLPLDSVTAAVNGRIVKLVLRNKNISSLPSDLGNLTALQYLDVSTNPLDSLPEAIGNLSQLAVLSCSHWSYGQPGSPIGLTKLPLAIGNLHALTQLFLIGNKLAELPSTIGNLDNLYALFLTSNRITELPREIGNLSNLYFFDISTNPLKSLPPEIGNLQKLYTINLADDSIQSLPNEIGLCSSLRSMNLLFNPALKNLPDSIVNVAGCIGVDDLRCEPISCPIRQWLEVHSNRRGWLDPQNCSTPVASCADVRIIAPKPSSNNRALHREWSGMRIYDLQGRYVKSSSGISKSLKYQSGVYVTLPVDTKSRCMPRLMAVINR